MNAKLRNELILIARQKISNEDPSHDINHILRVLKNAELIAKYEKADLDILIPAALFHDVVNYPKTDSRSKFSSDESAVVAKEILSKLKSYPEEKIDKVCVAIKNCSFSKGIIPDFIESKILQDADGLESVGAISIMRTYCSTGQYKRPLLNPNDPFCKKRQPEPNKYALDLFYSRLLVVQSRFHTKTAKKLGLKRTEFLKKFIVQLGEELI